MARSPTCMQALCNWTAHAWQWVGAPPKRGPPGRRILRGWTLICREGGHGHPGFSGYSPRHIDEISCSGILLQPWLSCRQEKASHHEAPTPRAKKFGMAGGDPTPSHPSVRLCGWCGIRIRPSLARPRKPWVRGWCGGGVRDVVGRKRPEVLRREVATLDRRWETKAAPSRVLEERHASSRQPD
jgi:hypothetical protein